METDYDGCAMKAPTLLLLFGALPLAAQQRPAIDGISHIAVYARDMAAAQRYYEHDMGLKKAADPENSAGTRYYVNATQFVEVLPLPAQAGITRLDHLAYKTVNAAGLRSYLAAKHVEVPATIQALNDGSKTFSVKDPEGNTVEFVQPGKADLSGAQPIGTRIIHVGMVVHDRAKEDTFYREILNFRPYWYGGGTDGRTSWVSQQTPDANEWLEYMLPREGQELTQKQAGVMNHYSIGVVNMEQAVSTLAAQDRLSTEHSPMQIGRDGKWQFNSYDDEGTRTELMEFTPVMTPCCSPITAPHPKP